MAKEYQLVTWSRDQTLRMWRIDPALQKLCGYEASPNSTVDDASTMLPTDRSIIGEFENALLYKLCKKKAQYNTFFIYNLYQI